MFQPIDMLIVERHKDLMREAANYWLAREAVAARPAESRGLKPALATLGRRLSAVGGPREPRYGEIKPEVRKAAL
jgi:hypothetical protein